MQSDLAPTVAGIRTLNGWNGLIAVALALEVAVVLTVSLAFDLATSGDYQATLHMVSALFFLVSLRSWRQTIFREKASGFVSITQAILLSAPGYTLLTAILGMPVDIWTLVLSTGAMLLALLTVRWSARRLVFGARKHAKFLDRAAVIGSKRELDDLISRITKDPVFGYEVVQQLELKVDAEPQTATASSRDLYTSQILESSVTKATKDVKAVFIAPSIASNTTLLESLLWILRGEGVEVYLSKPLGYVSSAGFDLFPAYNGVLLRMKDGPYRAGSSIVKRVFDLVGGILLLALSLPTQALVFVSILIIDRHFPLFSQIRVGLNGTEFKLFKFRTMKNGALEWDDALWFHANRAGNEVQFKLRRDPRVTTLGRLLRRLSLDELPQLVNVVQGTMSLVGPRPHVPSEVNRYEALAHNRLRLKPGITGAWQIGGRSDLSWQEAIALDLNYVQNWSLTLDFVILINTIWAVIRGRGAY